MLETPTSKTETPQFVIRAAVSDESNIGSIWIGGRAYGEERCLIKIQKVEAWRGWRWVFVDARAIDGNFTRRYNEEPLDVPLHGISVDGRRADRAFVARSGRHRIEWDNAAGRAKADTIVASQWYRNALGIASIPDNENLPRLMVVTCKERNWYGWLRASCQGPDPVVRLATRLGVLGLWLGMLGLMEPAQTLLNKVCHMRWPKAQCESYHAEVLYILLMTITVWFIVGCRGRPDLSQEAEAAQRKRRRNTSDMTAGAAAGRAPSEASCAGGEEGCSPPAETCAPPTGQCPS